MDTADGGVGNDGEIKKTRRGRSGIVDVCDVYVVAGQPTFEGTPTEVAMKERPCELIEQISSHARLIRHGLMDRVRFELIAQTVSRFGVPCSVERHIGIAASPVPIDRAVGVTHHDGELMRIAIPVASTHTDIDLPPGRRAPQLCSCGYGGRDWFLAMSVHADDNCQRETNDQEDSHKRELAEKPIFFFRRFPRSYLIRIVLHDLTPDLKLAGFWRKSQY